MSCDTSEAETGDSPAGALGFSELGWRVLAIVAVVVFASRLGAEPTAGPVAPYTSRHEKSPPPPSFFTRIRAEEATREIREHHRLRVMLPAGAGSAEDSAEFSNSVQSAGAAIPPGEAAASSETGWQIFVFVFAGVLVLLLAMRKWGLRLAEPCGFAFNKSAPVAAAVGELSATLMAEEQAFSTFANNFKIGPQNASSQRSTADPKPNSSASTPTDPASSQPEPDLLKAFFEAAPGRLAALRNLVRETSRAATEPDRQTVLQKLLVEVRVLKDQSNLPPLLPSWQMACALEGLVNQLAGKPQTVTPSTLRTVAGGVDSLESLCVPGVRPDLISNPPFQILAVDDDPISRHAISFALRKTLESPHVAERGESALALATEYTFDVIFLDVQMPGMDGFEVCTRIHETPLNRATPVVFVTCQNDFDTRCKSSSAGGHELIGKPFIAFEITVKALTLALRGRLTPGRREGGAQIPRKQIPAPSQKPPITAAGKIPGSAKALTGSTQTASSCESRKDPSKQGATSAQACRNSAASRRARLRKARIQRRLGFGESGEAEILTEPAKQPEDSRVVALTPPASEPIGELTSQTSARIQSFRVEFEKLEQTDDAGIRQNVLEELYLGFDSMMAQAELSRRSTASRLSAAIKGLLKRMLDDPRHCTPSTLNTAAAALDLLEELWSASPASDLAAGAPIRILVVDDEPIANRALCGALQLVFKKPETAQSGEAAIALAADEHFDVIFLDVMMPGLDGYATCLKLHETKANSDTPVVFVTSTAHPESESQWLACGGSDFILKPVFPAEIALKALTFALKSRLQTAPVS